MIGPLLQGGVKEYLALPETLRQQGEEGLDKTNLDLISLMKSQQDPEMGHTGYREGGMAVGLGLLLNMLDSKRQAGGDFVKGFLTADEQRRRGEYEKKKAKLDKEFEIGRMEAQINAQKHQRKIHQADRMQGQQQFGAKLKQEDAQFQQEDATRRYVADQGNSTKLLLADKAAEKERVKALMSKMTPAARQAFAQQFGMNQAVVEAMGELTAEEQLKVAQAGKVGAETQTINAERNPRVAKLNAEVARLVQGTVTDKARQAEIIKRTSLLDPQFRLKYADTLSKMAKREHDMSKGPTVDTAKMGREHLKDLEKRERIIRQQIVGAGTSFDVARMGAIQQELSEIAQQKDAITKGLAGVGQMQKDRAEGRKFMQQYPNKADAIRKRFRDTYGEDI